MKLEKGMRVALSAKHLKAASASHNIASRRGTYNGEYEGVKGYCRVIWDNAPFASQYADDAEYCEMARTLGEIHPIAIICGIKSAAFGDTYA